MTGSGQIIPLEAKKAFEEQLVAQCSEGCGGGPCQQCPPRPGLGINFPPPEHKAGPGLAGPEDAIGHLLPALALTELRQGSQGVAEPSPARLTTGTFPPM